MSLFENNNHPNANGSKWLSLIVIASFFIGLFLPLIFNTAAYSPALYYVTAFLLALSAFASIIGFENTFEANAAWKTGVQVISTAANILVPAFFVALS